MTTLKINVEMPALDNLPVALQPLVYRNAARVRHDPDFRGDMERLLTTIERNLADLSAAKTPLLEPQSFSESTLSPKALVDRGIEKTYAKNYQGAIADFDTALRLKPHDAIAYHNRGLAKSKLGEKLGAIDDFNTVIRLNPDYAEAHHSRGLTKSNSDDYREAAKRYQRLGDTESYNKALNFLERLGGKL